MSTGPIFREQADLVELLNPDLTPTGAGEASRRVLVDEWHYLTTTPQARARMQELLRLGRSQRLLLPQDIVADLHRDAVEVFEQNTKENR